MLWNFQYVKCLDKHVEQDDGRKSWVEKKYSTKTFEKNEHAWSMEGIFVVFGFDCPSVFKGGQPYLENSKLV